MQARPIVRWSLAALLATVAINAFAGGVYGMLGAQAVPRTWLAGTPFTSYFVPSVILFAIVGGSLAVAATGVFVGHRHARAWSLAAAAIVLGWITVQIAMIGLVSWLQPAIAIAGVAIAVLATALPGAHTGSV